MLCGRLIVFAWEKREREREKERGKVGGEERSVVGGKVNAAEFEEKNSWEKKKREPRNFFSLSPDPHCPYRRATFGTGAPCLKDAAYLRPERWQMTDMVW